jgi:hypothetical protein
VVTTDNGTNLDFMDVDGEIAPQHYAFLVTETEFAKFLVGFGHDRFPIGPIPPKRSRARSTITTMGVVSISKIPTVTS